MDMNQPIIRSEAHPATPPHMSEADCSTHLQEKHLQMIRNAQAAGREIPAVPVSMSAVGKDLARTAVEASQKTMRAASRRTFAVPELPWRNKKHA